MRFIKGGGFAIAFAVHGLLLALVPTEQKQKMSSGANEYRTLALSIGRQPLSVNNPSALDTVQKEPLEKSIYTDSAMSGTRLVTKTIQEKQGLLLTNKFQQTHAQKVIETKPSIEKEMNTNQLGAVPVQLASTEGVHETIITTPIFSSLPVPPDYPQLASKRGQQGTVWVDVLLDARGDQIRTDIFQSSGVSPLDRAALAAVKQWHFIAHRINDIAVASHIRIPIEFSLD